MRDEKLIPVVVWAVGVVGAYMATESPAVAIGCAFASAITGLAAYAVGRGIGHREAEEAERDRRREQREDRKRRRLDSAR